MTATRPQPAPPAPTAAVAAELDLLRIERDQAVLEVRRAHQAVDALRQKLRERATTPAPAPPAAAITATEHALAGVERGIDNLTHLYRVGTDLHSDVQAMADVHDIATAFTHQELTGLLVAAIRRLAQQSTP